MCAGPQVVQMGMQSPWQTQGGFLVWVLYVGWSPSLLSGGQRPLSTRSGLAARAQEQPLCVYSVFDSHPGSDTRGSSLGQDSGLLRPGSPPLGVLHTLYTQPFFMKH